MAGGFRRTWAPRNLHHPCHPEALCISVAVPAVPDENCEAELSARQALMTHRDIRWAVLAPPPAQLPSTIGGGRSLDTDGGGSGTARSTKEFCH